MLHGRTIRGHSLPQRRCDTYEEILSGLIFASCLSWVSAIFSNTQTPINLYGARVFPILPGTSSSAFPIPRQDPHPHDSPTRRMPMEPWLRRVLHATLPYLTTLAPHFHTSSYHLVMRFVVQFPNLENLTLENLGIQMWMLSGAPEPFVVDQPPPLRGHLRCANLGPGRIPLWSTEFAFDLQSGISFRSVEFKDVH